jgi:hypothetical protein
MGSLTLALAHSSSLFSADALQYPMQILIYFLFPGIIGSMATDGNVHAYSLVAAAVINVLVNFCVVWFLSSLLMRIKKPS